jgi:hypothetical protein
MALSLPGGWRAAMRPGGAVSLRLVQEKPSPSKREWLGRADESPGYEVSGTGGASSQRTAGPESL